MRRRVRTLTLEARSFALASFAMLAGVAACSSARKPSDNAEAGHGGAGATAGSSGGLAGEAGSSSGAGGDGTGGGGTGGSEAGFEPIAGLDGPGVARRVGSAFWTAEQELLSEPGGGGGWLLSRSYADPDFSGETVHLDRFDARGVWLESSALADHKPDGLLLHADGALSAFRNNCGDLGSDVCFTRDDGDDALRETVWPHAARSFTRYALDDDGDVLESSPLEGERRHVVAATAADGPGLVALVYHGGSMIYGFDAEYAELWSAEFLPAVSGPELPPEAPLDEVLRNAELSLQHPCRPVVTSAGIFVAAAVTRGTLAALNETRGLDLALPADPRCPDVLIARFSRDGSDVMYASVPTVACEHLPTFTVVGEHAFVASVLRVEKAAEPNDTFQYDIGLAIVDLETGEVVERTLAMEEDDIVKAIAPCGDQVCLSGMSGARSVDTGSTVTFGKGFVWPIDPTGEPDRVRWLTSARHSEIRLLAGAPGGVYFFAWVNAPITHTADSDPSLRFNEGLLGYLPVP